MILKEILINLIKAHHQNTSNITVITRYLCMFTFLDKNLPRTLKHYKQKIAYFMLCSREKLALEKSVAPGQFKAQLRAHCQSPFYPK